MPGYPLKVGRRRTPGTPQRARERANAAHGPFSAACLARLRRARVARLATADARGRPHVVPICFAAEARAVYHAIDAKPKGRPAAGLRRVRNMVENPRVALLVDHYEEDWRRLWFVLVRGRARLLRRGPARARGLRLLRRKYAQYRRGHPRGESPRGGQRSRAERIRGMLPQDALVIAIKPDAVSTWGLGL